MSARLAALRYRIEYGTVAAAIAVRGVLPSGVALAGMKGLAGLTCSLVRSRRKAALELVHRTLDLPADGPEARAIVRGSFRALALNSVETEIVAERLRRGEPLERFVSIEGGEHLRTALESGRSLIWCSGHLGAWELFPLVIRELGTPLWTVARTLRNPLLERRLSARRERYVRGVLPKDGGGLRLARLVRSGEPVGLLLDQNAGREGVILEFLGRPSSHYNVAGVLARRFGALVVPFYLLREIEPLRFRLIVEAPIEADRSLSDDESAVDVTRRLSRSLECQVRAHPAQWFWLHDRWRHAERRLERQQIAAARRAAAQPAGDERRPAPQSAGG